MFAQPSIRGRVPPLPVLGALRTLRIHIPHVPFLRSCPVSRLQPVNLPRNARCSLVERAVFNRVTATCRQLKLSCDLPDVSRVVFIFRKVGYIAPQNSRCAILEVLKSKPDDEPYGPPKEKWRGSPGDDCRFRPTS